MKPRAREGRPTPDFIEPADSTSDKGDTLTIQFPGVEEPLEIRLNGKDATNVLYKEIRVKPRRSIEKDHSIDALPVALGRGVH